MAVDKLDGIATPAIPLPPNEYSRVYHESLNNVLRLYFNRLGGNVNTILSPDNGARFLSRPNALFYSTVDQSAAAVDTGYPITFNQTYKSDDISLVSNSRITAVYSGIYSFKLSVQLNQTNSSAEDVYIWINRNGTDQPYGAHHYVVSGSNSALVANWVFDVDITAGQYIEFKWSTTDTGVTLNAEAAASPHPGIPSAVCAVNYVSAL